MARKISELSDIEFKGSLSQQIHEYGERLEKLTQRLAFEFEVATVDSQAAMESLSGQWWLLGIDVKLKARRVAKRPKRMQEAAHGMSKQAAKMHRAYLRHFPEAGS